MKTPSFKSAGKELARAQNLDRIKGLVLNAVSSEHSRAAYGRALDDFLAWFSAEPRPFVKATVQEWAAALVAQGLAPATVNLRLSAVRKLAREAADNGLLDPQIAEGIARARGIRTAGVRAGNWLTREQTEALLVAPPADKLAGKRDRAALAVLVGCGLRRSELSSLRFRHVQQREGRWVIVDLVGKGRRVRTVPMPAWAKALIDEWTTAAAALIGEPSPDGFVFLPVRVSGLPAPGPWLPQNIRDMVARRGERAGLPGLAAHDLRRTHAKLARAGGAPLEQIQIVLGHASIQTTEKYLGARQDLSDAPCDRLGIKIDLSE